MNMKALLVVGFTLALSSACLGFFSSRSSTPAVADAFCATPLDGDWGRAFGTMPKGLDTQAIVDRSRIQTAGQNAQKPVPQFVRFWPKQTWASAQHVSAAGGKADIMRSMDVLLPYPTLR